jgi:hypothetical protein
MEVLDDYILEEELSEKEVDWQLFLGEKFDYYRPIWNKIEQGHRVQFNIYAFIFSGAWAAYRKMYVVFFVLCFFNISLDYIPVLLDSLGIGATLIPQIISWIGFLLCGFFGNLIYYKSAIKKIATIKAAQYSKALEEQSIIKAGGTDFIFPIVATIVLVGLIIGFNYYWEIN